MLKNNEEASAAATEWGVEDGIESAPRCLHFGFHSE